MAEASAMSDTRLPRAVRAQIKRTNERLESKPSVDEPALPEVDPSAPNEPASTAVTELPDPQSGAPQGDPRHSDPAYWRQRFQVIEGMQRAKGERHQEEIATLHQQLDEMRTQLRAFEGQTTSAKKDLHKQFFTPEQIEQFGEDQCEAMAKAAVQAAQSQVQAAIETEVKPIRERAAREEQNAALSKREQFQLGLAEQVPDYLEYDKLQPWREWLAEIDPGSGLQRQEILNTHMRSLDFNGVANLFKAHKALSAPPAPPVAPSRGPGGGGQDPTPPAVGDGRGYPTTQEIRDFGKRAATIRNPRDPRYVTDKERASFEARLRLPKPGA